MSSCTHRTRNAEQRWPALLNADCTASMTTCSGSAELSTIIAFCPPVSAISVPIGPLRPASVRWMIRAVSVEPVKATPATRGSATAAAPTTRAVARQEMQHVGRYAGLQQQPHGVGGHQRRLLGRLGQHRIARRERGGDLAGEDREREIPRADAGEHAAAVQAQFVALARRSRQALRARELVPRPGRVVPQEIHRLAHLGDAVRHGLARLAHAHRDELRRAVLEQVGRLVQRIAAHRGRRGVPARLCADRDVDGGAHMRRPSALATVPTTSALFAGLRIVSVVAPGRSSPPTSGAATQGRRDTCSMRAAIAWHSAPFARCIPSEFLRSGW